MARAEYRGRPAGLLDLGYVAFYAIGAYGLALGYQYLGLGFWAMLPLGALMAALAGALLAFRCCACTATTAIVTLGFGEIIRLVLNNWMSLTGGPNGVSVPAPTVFGTEFGRRAKDGGVPIHEFRHRLQPQPQVYFHLCGAVLVVLLVLYIKHRLTRMPIGRAREALREDEIACRSLGLNHVLVKLSAFMLGASTAGLAGCFRHLSGLRQPDLVHLLRVGADPGNRGVGRHGVHPRRGAGGLRADGGAGAAAQLRGIPGAAVRRADGGDDDLASARAGAHQPRQLRRTQGVAP